MKKLFTLLTMLIVAITSSWAGVTTTHTPGKYESATGYNTALTTYDERDYEVYYVSWKSSKAYVAAGKSYVTDDKAYCLISNVSNNTTDGIDFSDGWGNIVSAGFSGSNTSPAAEWAVSASNNSTHYVPLTSSSSVTLKISGYDQFSFAGRDGSKNAESGQFVVTIDGEAKTMTHTTTDWSTYRFDISTGEHTIVITGDNSSTASRFRGFSLRLPNATKHKVEYNLGDATGGTAPTQADVAEGAKFTVANAPSNLVPPTGKEFKCWNDGTNDYNEGAEYTMGTSDVEFTAVYQNETVKYAVSYAAGEGTGSMDGTEKAEGAVFNLPASTFTVPEGKVFANWLCNVDGETYAEGDPYTMTATATTFTAQYVAVAPKIIYSLVDGIGSAEKTANTATVTEGTSLVISDTDGRITITAVTGDTFKNGDAIAFSGTVGNTSRPFGIKYGASTANTNLYVAAGQPCSVSGTLTLDANSNTLVMGRYGGTTTTMTDFVVSRSVGVSSESIANIYINGVSATEGTDYTVSGNTITLSKTYLVCPVVRIVGNATFADETTGKTNHAVTLALDEDTYTGTATIAGTTYTVNAPYKAGESIDLSNTDGYNYGFGGYCAPENFTVTGGTAYAAKIVNNKIVLTSYDTDYIPKNTGVIIAGDKGATVTITYTATTTPNLAFPDNDLKGTNARTLTATLKGSAAKFLTLQKSTSKFIQYTGEYFPANRAYLLIESASAPESLEMVFADEATAIKEVNADENANSATPVKVIKNGKLYIGNFNVAGQQVK